MQKISSIIQSLMIKREQTIYVLINDEILHIRKIVSIGTKISEDEHYMSLAGTTDPSMIKGFLDRHSRWFEKATDVKLFNRSKNPDIYTFVLTHLGKKPWL